jgi:polyphosphate kinase
MNRELSLLEFQRRVLEEANDPNNRLLERVKFISIVSSNIDEFFMVRVAAMKQKLAKGNQDLSIDGKTVPQQLVAVAASVDQLVKSLYDCYQNQLLPRLAENDIVIADYSALDERERKAVDRYYMDTVFPVLTPLAFDPGRPFPHISNLSLNLAVVLRDTDGRRHFARIKVPEACRLTAFVARAKPAPARVPTPHSVLSGSSNSSPRT